VSFVYVLKDDNGSNGFLVLAEVETGSGGLHVTKINVHNRGTTKTFTFDFPSGGQHVVGSAAADSLNAFSTSEVSPAPNLNLRIGGWGDDVYVFPKLYDGANAVTAGDVTVS
jgi:hypothetical protein